MEIGRARGPVLPPGVLGVRAVRRWNALGVRRHAGIARIGNRGAGRIALAPEAVPAPLRPVEGEGGVGDRPHGAETGADVDMGAGAEPRELRLDPRVLPQALEEGADRVEGRHVHLLFELGEAVGGEALGDPAAVGGEGELRPAD
jgi:hypothetical protein